MNDYDDCAWTAEACKASQDKHGRGDDCPTHPWNVTYTCTYLTSRTEAVSVDYQVDSQDGLWQAMALHNAALPEYRTKVLKWVSPEGITFLMHDSKAV